MSMDDLLHTLKVSKMISAQVSCTDAAAVNTAFTTTNLDCKGYESNMFILYLADANNTPDMVFTMYETDVSATDSGTACAAADVMVVREDNVVTKCPVATGVLTLTHNDDEDHVYIFQYRGNKRWIRLTASVGTADITPGVLAIQSHARREPYYTAV